MQENPTSSQCQISREELMHVLSESGYGAKPEIFSAYFDRESEPPTCCSCHQLIAQHFSYGSRARPVVGQLLGEIEYELEDRPSVSAVVNGAHSSSTDQQLEAQVEQGQQNDEEKREPVNGKMVYWFVTIVGLYMVALISIHISAPLTKVASTSFELVTYPNDHNYVYRSRFAIEAALWGGVCITRLDGRYKCNYCLANSCRSPNQRIVAQLATEHRACSEKQGVEVIFVFVMILDGLLLFFICAIPCFRHGFSPQGGRRRGTTMTGLIISITFFLIGLLSVITAVLVQKWYSNNYCGLKFHSIADKIKPIAVSLRLNTSVAAEGPVLKGSYADFSYLTVGFSFFGVVLGFLACFL